MEQIEISCPWCGDDVPLSGTDGWQRCPHCRESIDVKAQLCYLRGSDAFSAAAKAAPPGSKKSSGRDYLSVELEYYVQAYTGLQEALQGKLSPRQRRSAVASMAEIAGIFAGRMMVSTLEANYWQKQAIELNTRKELRELQDKIAQSGPSGIFGPLRRSLWQLRSRQLTTALAKLEREVRTLEKNIAFTYKRTEEV